MIVCDTVYILVDNRGLSNLRNAHGIVPHWPPAAAWWASRVQLVGPFRERTDVVSIRICEATGLANVHPTWAGTFVLAGMVALYPHIHFALIDNDCLPLTLFEVAELWNLASPERVPIGSHSADREEPTRMEDDAGMQQMGYPHKRARTDPDSEPCPPQGVIIFTEPHSELNGLDLEALRKQAWVTSSIVYLQDSRPCRYLSRSMPPPSVLSASRVRARR